MHKLEELFDTFLDFTAAFIGVTTGHTLAFIYNVFMFAVEFIEAVADMIIYAMRR